MPATAITRIEIRPRKAGRVFGYVFGRRERAPIDVAEGFKRDFGRAARAQQIEISACGEKNAFQAGLKASMEQIRRKEYREQKAKANVA